MPKPVKDTQIPAQAPFWANTTTRAGKKRKRLPLACLVCRRQKIRCSGEQPKCGYCSQRKQACVYVSQRCCQRIEVRPRCFGVQRNYLEGVLARFDRVLLSSERNPPLPNVAPSRILPETAEKDEVEIPWPKPLSRSSASLTNSSGPECQSSLYDWVLSEGQEEQGLLCEGIEDLPPPDVQRHLADIFFERVAGQHPLLFHGSHFLDNLAWGCVAPVLILAVCSVAARFSDHPAVCGHSEVEAGQKWAEISRALALKRYDRPHITIVRTYLLLSIYDYAACAVERSWMMSGMALRMAYSLRIHTRMTSDPGSDHHERRAVWWSCFLFDRFNSFANDRPLVLSSSAAVADHGLIETTSPSCVAAIDGKGAGSLKPHLLLDVSDDSLNANTLRLVMLWADVAAYVGSCQVGHIRKEKDTGPLWLPDSIFKKIKKSTTHWYDHLPLTLRYNQANISLCSAKVEVAQFLLMHLGYHQTMLVLHQSAVQAYSDSERESLPAIAIEFLDEAQRRVKEAAEDISEIIHREQDHLTGLPFAGYCALSASEDHIHGAFSKNPAVRLRSEQHLAWMMIFLDKMKQHWGVFRSLANRLREIYQQYSDLKERQTAAPPAMGSMDRSEAAVQSEFSTSPAQSFPDVEALLDFEIDWDEALSRVHDLFPQQTALCAQ